MSFLTGHPPQRTSALRTRAKTAPYAEHAGTATRASACRVSRAPTARLTWMSVPQSPAGTAPPVRTEWATSPVCVLLGSPVSEQNCAGKLLLVIFVKRENKGLFLSTIIIVWCVSMAHEKAQWWGQSLTKLAPAREVEGSQNHQENLCSSIDAKKMPTAVAALWFINFAAVFPDFCHHKRHSDQHTGLLKTLWILVWQEGCISV